MFSPLKLDVEDFCDIVFILAHFVLLQKLYDFALFVIDVSSAYAYLYHIFYQFCNRINDSSGLFLPFLNLIFISLHNLLK